MNHSPHFQHSLLGLFLFCLGFLSLHAQAPQGVSFQAVARDASGIPMANLGITVVFDVQTGAGVTVYRESHLTTTDGFGLFTVVMGKGTPLTGTFAAIDWSTGDYQVQLEVDDGLGLIPLGTTPLESVPYALYAERADLAVGELTDVNLTGLGPGQTIVWNGTEWVPTTPTATVWSQTGTSAHYDVGRVGIGIDTPMTTLHLRDTANVLFGESLTGSGFKLLWLGNKGALRMGSLSNPFGGYNYDKFWDYDSVGFYSFAGGQNSRAKGFGSFAFGSFGWADGSGSVAFFGNARGNNSFTFRGSSLGRGSITFEGTAEEEGGIAMYGYTGGRYGVSIGGGTTGLGASSSREDYAVAIGWNADARGQASIALGPSDAYGYNSFSTGWVTEARGNYSSTFGYRTHAYPYASMALGRYNLVTGDSANWVGSDPVFMIGDGTSDANRSNSFIIQKNGQTAIGYDTPTGMLQVRTLGSLNNGGALDATNASLLLGTAAAGLAFDPNQIEVIGNGLHLNFNSPENVYLVNGGGNVALGHAAPAARLDVLSPGWQFHLQNDGPGGNDWYLGSSANNWAAGGNKFVISPNNGSGNSVFVIDPDLQFGLNQLNPTDRLHISADAGEDALRVQVGGITRLRVHDNGGVSIGANIGPPPAGLLVSGSTSFGDDVYPDADNAHQLGTAIRRWDIVWAANGTIQTSDARYKTGIEPLDYGRAEVLKLRPVRYRWKAQPTGDEKVGLIAQELRQVMPELVHGDAEDDAPLGVNYSELVPVLIQAIQEQDAQLQQQQAQIEALQRQVELLLGSKE